MGQRARGQTSTVSLPWLVTVTAVLIGLGTSGHAQLLGDAGPYFVWPDRWVGTVSGSEVLQREMNAQGAYVKMASTSTADAQVLFNETRVDGAVVRWWGEGIGAHVTYRAGMFLNAGASSQVVDSTEGEGDVVLGQEPRTNGLSIDVAGGSYTLALHSCTRERCDEIPVTRKTTIAMPGMARAFGDAGPDEQGVGITAEMPLPAPGGGLKATFAPPPRPVAGSTQTLRLEHDLTPEFELVVWAAAYRASYVEARQAQLDTFKDYAAKNCSGGSSLFESDPVCRAAARAKDQLDENANLATKDFARVTSSLVLRKCPGFITALNRHLGRSRDVVLEGPIATYRAVREVLFETVVEDPHVSYDRQPEFMRCLYDYDTYEAMVTLRLPGTSPIP